MDYNLQSNSGGFGADMFPVGGLFIRHCVFSMFFVSRILLWCYRFYIFVLFLLFSGYPRSCQERNVSAARRLEIYDWTGSMEFFLDLAYVLWSFFNEYFVSYYTFCNLRAIMLYRFLFPYLNTQLRSHNISWTQFSLKD